MSAPVALAVDAMGGDHAPQVVVTGSVGALLSFEDITLHLVGREEEIVPLLGEVPERVRPRLHLRHAPEVVEMGEPTRRALRKRASSVALGACMVRDGEAAAFVSAGNTGAVVGAAVLQMRLLAGVERPGIAAALPTTAGAVVLCDVGANIYTKPRHLLHYAVMASAYARLVLGIGSPRVGLLNIGTEAEKGIATVREARRLLEGVDVGFVGPIEGHRVFAGDADVVVCDGFTGNTILKASEGIGQAMLVHFERALAAGAMGERERGWLESGLKRLREITDYAEYGGAPLLGIEGCVIKAHGRSEAKAITSAIGVAREFARRDVNQAIAEGLRAVAAAGEGEAS